jgi:hypothetical protein
MCVCVCVCVCVRVCVYVRVRGVLSRAEHYSELVLFPFERISRQLWVQSYHLADELVVQFSVHACA